MFLCCLSVCVCVCVCVKHKCLFFTHLYNRLRLRVGEKVRPYYCRGNLTSNWEALRAWWIWLLQQSKHTNTSRPGWVPLHPHPFIKQKGEADASVYTQSSEGIQSEERKERDCEGMKAREREIEGEVETDWVCWPSENVAKKGWGPSLALSFQSNLYPNHSSSSSARLLLPTKTITKTKKLHWKSKQEYELVKKKKKKKVTNYKYAP